MCGLSSEGLDFTTCKRNDICECFLPAPRKTDAQLHSVCRNAEAVVQEAGPDTLEVQVAHKHYFIVANMLSCKLTKVQDLNF